MKKMTASEKRLFLRWGLRPYKLRAGWTAVVTTEFMVRLLRAVERK
jgi:hypothetical protein